MKDTRFKCFRDVSSAGPDRTFRPASPPPGQKAGPGEEAPGEETAGSDPGPGEEGPEENGPEEEGLEEEGGGQKESGPESPEGPWDEVRGLYDEEGGRKDARQAAARAATEQRAFATPGAGGNLYARDLKRGVFRPNGEEVLRGMLLEELGPRHSTGEVRQVQAKVRAMASSALFGTAEVIPLAGGDLSLSPVELLEPSPKRPFLYRSTARWDPSAECPPALKGVLQQAVSSKRERRALQEHAGCCLLHWARPYRTALLLVGPGAEAQRVYLRAIGAVVPWVGSVAPSRLAKSRSKRPQLHGPWVNICAGISPETLPEMELFDKFGPGGPARSDPSELEATRKKPVPRRPAKHVYTAETLPEIFPGKSFFRRLQLVSFSGTWSPEGPWPKLARKLQDQRDGVLQWAARGLRRFLQEGGFSLSRSPKETRRKWETHGDSILRFKAEKLEVTGDLQRHFEPKGTTHEAYRRFCKAEGLSPTEKRQALTGRLKEDPRISDGKRTPEGQGDQMRCYEGIILREL